MKWLLIIALIAGYLSFTNRLLKEADRLSRDLAAVYALASDQPVQLLGQAETVSRQPN
jgi:hypothetical protein